MKLLALLALTASLAVSTYASLPPPGDGTFSQGGAICKTFDALGCGNRFKGTLLPGGGQPRYYAYERLLQVNPSYDPCAVFTKACTDRLSNAVPMVRFGCQPFNKSTNIIAAYCSAYQNHGQALEVTSETGNIAGLQEVTPKPPAADKGPGATCNVVQNEWCAVSPTQPFPLADQLP